jgi:serine/threonine protein phosphatase PrpC
MSANGDLRFVSSAATHRGTVRALNEDALLDRPDLGLWAVADGMGGHQAGDYASRVIVHALHGLDPPESAPEFLAAASECLEEANSLLRRAAAERGGSLIGSTVVVLLAFDSHFACLWAGDSRLYRFQGGELTRLSRDHSQVQELVDSGVLAFEDAERHPAANVITRAVGARDTLELEIRQGRIEPDDMFLLCSDGLFKALSEEAIAAVLRTCPVADGARILIDQALEHHATDNVTAIHVSARGPGDCAA